MLKFISIISAAASAGVALLSAPVMAAEPGDVTLNVLSGPGSEMRWTPTGAAVRDIPLCITSQNGNFLIDVTTQGSTSGNSQKLDFVFTDPHGSTDSVTGTLGNLVTLQGTVDQAEDCRSGANAKVRVSLDRADVLAGVAGDLSFTINFAVRAR